MAAAQALVPDELATRITTRTRFVVPSGCFEWTGPVNNWGYGYTTVKNVKRPVHRLAYELNLGAIPSDFVIDHTCRNRRCVNPSHLQAITKNENTALGGTRKTHCPQGHEYSDANTYRYGGNRQCKACRLERSRLQNAARSTRRKETAA